MSNLRIIFALSVLLFLLSVFFTNAFAQYGCGPYGCTPTPVPKYWIQAFVFLDTDRSGSYQSGEPLVWNHPVNLTSRPTQYTDTYGRVLFDNLISGWYTLSFSPPNGYAATTSTSENIYVGPSRTRYLGYAAPPPPVIVADPPSAVCSGNNPFVSFNFSSAGATWYEVYQIIGGNSTLVQNSASTTFSTTYAPGLRGTSVSYQVRAFYVAGSGVYTATTSQPVILPDCYYSISGNVFIDYDRDGVWNGIDTAYTGGATMTLAGSAAGSQTTGGSGNYSFADLLAGNYTVTLTVPSTYVPSTATQLSYTPLNSVVANQRYGVIPTYDIPPVTPTPGPGPQPTPTPGNGLPTPTLPPGPAPSDVGGIVFNDHDRSGTYTTGDTPYTAGATIRLTGSLTYGNPTFNPQSTVSDGNGLYGFYDLYHGTYTLQLDTTTIPTRYQATTATSSNPITLPPDTPGKAFGVVPRYSISGIIFDDRNKDGIKNGAEPAMSGNYEVTVNGIPYTAVNGVFDTGNVLYEGTYTVSYTSTVPDGYRMTYPQNGPPPSFTVTVGRSCSESSPDASCVSAGLPFAASDIQNLNFGMTNYIPWFQIVCDSSRINNGIVNDGSNNAGFTDIIPDNPSATCGTPYASTTNNACTTPGVIYSDGSVDLGPRDEDAASTLEWVVENDTFSSDQFRTSYDYITTTLRQSGVTPINLNQANRCGAGGINNCTLDANLTSGVYLADGDLNLNAYNFQQYKNYVILVNGDLNILGEIKVPVGSTAIFSVAGDITVAPTIGVNNVCSQTTNVEGFYSTDGRFVIDGTNDCSVGPDLRFNLGGTVVTNADGNTAGSSIENRRDLCADDRNAPAFAIFNRPDLVLYTPEFLKYKSDAWREVAP